MTGPGAGALTRLGHLLVAAVAGFLILALEFTAVRLMAPSFGQGQYVWANVIGVILVTLTLGYALGGRLGERSRSGRPLYLAYGVAAVWVLLVVGYGRALCAALVPTGLPDPDGLPLAFTGSLVASLVLFGPPALLLAMTSPFLIRLQARKGEVGAAAGMIYAAGTVGSLVACHIVPLVWLQVWGTQLTLLVCAGGCAALCLGGLVASRGVTVAPPAVSETAATRLAPRLFLIAVVSGWAVTVLEFGAVRFMSPWFGQSNHVWANVIGLILLALAIGSWIGGRWADAALARGPAGARSLFGALGVATLAIAIAAWAGPALLDALMPAGVDSLRILPVAREGSRAAALLLFGLPMILLGVTAPFLVRMAAGAGHAGRAAGSVFAWTTVGGLVGCLTTSSLLVPALGSRGALLMAAVALGLLALLLIPARATGGRVGAASVLAAIGLLVATGLLGQHVMTRPALRLHAGQLVEIESGYQTIRVVRETLPMGAPGPDETIVPAVLPREGKAETLFLRHDEDAETYQSVLVENDVRRNAWMTGGRYFEHMAVGAFFAAPPDAQGVVHARDPKVALRVLIIGYAGGTVHRTLRQAYAGPIDLLGVEIDPAVVDIAREYLRHGDLEQPRPGVADRLRLVTGEDARTVVNALPDTERFDLVLVDAYARTNYVPFQLATIEFFEKAARHLTPGGWVGVNVLGHGFRGPVAKSVARTMDEVFGGCWAAPNPAYPGNVILWSQPGAREAPRLWSPEAVGALGGWHPAMAYAGMAIERYLVGYDRAHDGGERLTDDRSPSDKLADEELGL
ncbi:MAG: fused MFS/spermidine synthase [Planctomycetota bacterium]|nr:fused MFS/spermidine synthase [Planctomycetota bacterium]